MMKFATRSAAGQTVKIIEAPEDLKTPLSDAFRKQLAKLVRNGNYKIVIDLSKTSHVDSSGLGAMVSQIATCRANNGDIRLAAPAKFLVSLLEITQLNQILRSFKNIDQAVESYQE